MPTSQHHIVSVCIPSYNRPQEIKRLLEGLYAQNSPVFEVVIAEDVSPKREEIKQIVEELIARHPDFNLRLHLNEKNLGYDGNLRSLFSLAKGDFCMFMGDDDVVCDGAMQKVIDVLTANPNIGMALRAWEEVDLEGKLLSTSHYYPADTLFEAGWDTIAQFFRKSIFISGLIFHRETALKYHTDKFDGLLLYQVYLLTMVLQEKQGFYIAKTLTQRLRGAEHYFGSSESEKGLFEPKMLKPEHSLNFMQGFLKILDNTGNAQLKTSVLKDFSNKAFGYLSLQRGNGMKSFINYSLKLRKLGYAQTFPFWVFFFMLLILGETTSERLILSFKKIKK